MPFSSLKDPSALARASAAMEKAWAEIEPSIAPQDQETERARLAYIVAGLVSLATDEDTIVEQAIAHFCRRA